MLAEVRALDGVQGEGNKAGPDLEQGWPRSGGELVRNVLEMCPLGSPLSSVLLLTTDSVLSLIYVLINCDIK